MSKQQTLIITGCDESMYPVLDLTLKSKTEYAQKYGYDLLIQRAFLPYNFKDRHISVHYDNIGFLRVAHAFKHLQEYDTVMWIDADAIITNKDIAISEIVGNDDSVLITSYDWTVPEGQTNQNHTFSTGNYIIRKTDLTEQFYELLLTVANSVLQGTVFVEGWTEQYILNTIYAQGSDEVRRCIKVKEHKYLNAVPATIATTKTWQDNPHRLESLHSPWNPDCFLAHLTGCTTQDRVQLLQEYFNIYI